MINTKPKKHTKNVIIFDDDICDDIFVKNQKSTSALLCMLVGFDKIAINIAKQ